MKNHVLDGVMGLCVADAIGVPVEFSKRKTLMQHPVVDMRSFGTYDQPAGTWSDDTSMTLALMDSLSKGLDYHDIMLNFTKWLQEGDYSPFNEVFDVGNTTRKALTRFESGVSPLECGGRDEYDNGNGSLMRILPIVFYLLSLYGTDFCKNEESFEIIHRISGLTHGNPRSQMACGIYISVASKIMEGLDLNKACELGIHQAMSYYRKQDLFLEQLIHFARLKDKGFVKLPVKSIKSSGYVIDTLEAALWCLLTTNNYKQCVLKAVNLGEDTDSVAAVAGGLAGLYYGNDDIPIQWRTSIIKKEYVEELCNVFNDSLFKEKSSTSG